MLEPTEYKRFFLLLSNIIMKSLEKDKKKLAKKEYDRKRYIENRELILSNSITYYRKNSEKRSIAGKEYYRKNSQKIKTRTKNNTKNRLNNDPIFKMVCNLRARLRSAFKNQGVTKDIRTKKLFGCSQEEVWNHLESLFKEGMTRENHGLKGWHIDHIKPMSSFDLSNPEQLKECCHYKNLQPLWWWENLSKGDKTVA